MWNSFTPAAVMIGLACVLATQQVIASVMNDDDSRRDTQRAGASVSISVVLQGDAVRVIVPDDDADEELRRERAMEVLQNLIDAEMRILAGPGAAGRTVDLPDDRDLTRVQPSEELMLRIAELDHPDFHRRHVATAQLLDDMPDLDEVLAVLAHHNLSAEQRHRLTLVARELILNRPRGAIGIRMQPAQEGVHVVGLLPGLPAEHILQVGDVLTHINGVRPVSQNAFVDMIQSHKPGETVSLTILRTKTNEDGERTTHTMTVDITLGTAELLNEGDDWQTSRTSHHDAQQQRRADEMARRWGPAMFRPVYNLQPDRFRRLRLWDGR